MSSILLSNHRRLVRIFFKKPNIWTQLFFSKLNVGIPEIDLGSIDPMFIGKTVVEQGDASSPVNLKIQMKNTTVLGAKQFVVNKVV